MSGGRRLDRALVLIQKGQNPFNQQIKVIAASFLPTRLPHTTYPAFITASDQGKAQVPCLST